MKQCILISLLLFVTQLHSSQDTTSPDTALNRTKVYRCNYPDPGFENLTKILQIGHHPGFILPPVASDSSSTTPDYFQLRLLHNHALDDKWEKTIFNNDQTMYNILFDNDPEDPNVVTATIETRKHQTLLTETEQSLLHYVIIEYLSKQRLHNRQNELENQMREEQEAFNKQLNKINENLQNARATARQIEQLHATTRMLQPTTTTSTKPKSRWYNFCRTSTVKESPKHSPQQ